MSDSPVACREIFDENSQPSQEEIVDYAHHIGIDPSSESHLLPLAKDGLMQALPHPWKAYLDENLKTHYYYNPETGVTQWEHPLDRVYRSLVVRARTASERERDLSVHTDTCASVQELLTYEESSKKADTKNDSPEQELTSESDTSQSEVRHELKRPAVPLQRPTELTPLNRPFGALNSLGIKDRKLDELRSSHLRRSIDSSFPRPKEVKDLGTDLYKGMALFDKPALFRQQSEIIDLSMKVGQDDGVNFMTQRMEKGLSFTGKGSVFLKRPGSNFPSPDTEKSLPFDMSTKSEPPRGILREKTFELEKRPERKIEKELDDDKKSVRFNLERNDTEVASPSPSSTSSDQHQSSIVSNISTSKQTTTAAKIAADLPPRPARSLKLSPIVAKNDQARKELPLRPKTWIQRDTQGSEDKPESTSSERSDAPNPAQQTKRLLKPPAAEFIKPNLFQKQFDKIADIIKPMSLDTDSESDVKARPRSPMIPQKNKISINLMESIESETSIDSPDKEFVDLDLNDISDSIQPKEKEEMKPKLPLNISDLKVSSHTFGQEKKARIQQMEGSIQAELRKIRQDLEEKKTAEEKRLKQELEVHLKKLKEDICKEQQVETDKLNDRLKKQHEEHKAEIEKAISNSQEQHKLSLQHVMDNIQLKLEAEKEDKIRRVQERQRKEIEEVIEAMKKEHNDNIARIKEEKSDELSRIRTKLELDNARSVREMRETLSAALEVERARLLSENRTALDKLKRDHDALCDDIRKDYRSEVELLRSQHSCHLAELRSRLASERDAERRKGGSDNQRQLEDKYRCLKEKYARLKSDVKMSIERRNKRREQSMTTGSETEKSNSHKTAQALDNGDRLSRFLGYC